MRWRDSSAPRSVRAHETTTRHAGALYPLLHDVGHGTPGALIGLDLLGGLFCFDPFELYRAGIVSNPNLAVFGQIGRGKSSLVKTYLFRQLAFGRHAFIVDPKGEYGPLCAAAGVSPLRLAPGGPLRLNPLDLADGTIEATRGRRLQLLEALAASTMGRSLLPRERAAIDVALSAIEGGARAPTIPEVVDALLQPDASSAARLRTTPAELADEGRDVALELRRLVCGDLAGMFDEPTSPELDRVQSLVALDLSALYGSQALGVLMTCATAWLHALVQRRTVTGAQIILVVDEAWAILRDVAVARWLQSSWKLSRAWGVSNVAVLHRVSDLDAVGAEGSEERSIAKGLLLDSETRVIYAQPPGEAAVAAGLLGLTAPEQEVLGRLGRGTALWKLGEHGSLVRHLVGRHELAFVDTDSEMRAR